MMIMIIIAIIIRSRSSRPSTNSKIYLVLALVLFGCFFLLFTANKSFRVATQPHDVMGLRHGI